MSGAESNAEERYAGFISFKDGRDTEFAESLQREVQRFAKPWNKLRAIRVFRYDTNLPASPSLWTSIQEALSSSRWFILLASPPAAASAWVGKEIEWWVANRDSSRRILLVLTDGNLVWDEAARDFDAARSTALHPALRGVFRDEPRWVDARWTRDVTAPEMRDPRMQRVVVDVASALRGLEKDTLVGDAAREHRRTRRLVRSAVATLAFLLVIAVGAGVFAWGQRNTALDALRVSESRQLAALAQQHSERDIGLAALLALAAHQLDPNGETQAALAQAALGGPMLSRVGQFSDTISTVATNTNPNVAVAALDNGDVALWDMDAAKTDVLGSLNSDVLSVSASRDGAVALAATENGAYVVDDGSVYRVAIPVDLSAGDPRLVTAMAPDGTRAWVGSADFEHGFGLCEVDMATLNCTTIPTPFMDDWSGGLSLMVSESGVLTLFEPAYGRWARVDLSSMSVASSGSYGGFGTYQAIPALSPDGSWLGVATHDTAQRVEMWPSTATGSAGSWGIRDSSDVRTVATHLTPRTTSYAIAPGGDTIAVGYVGGVSLVQNVESNFDDPTVIELVGAEDISQLYFEADGLGLLGVRGDRILRWDLRQQSRIANASFDLPLRGGCAACGPPVLAVAPDESKALALTPADAIAAIVDIATGHVITLADESSFLFGYEFAQPVWTADSQLILPVTGVPGASGPSSMPDYPPGAGVVSWSRHAGDKNSLAIFATHDGSVMTVDDDGSVREYGAADGSILDARPITDGSDLKLWRAAFNPQGTLLVAFRQDPIDSSLSEVLIMDMDRKSTTVLTTGAYAALAWESDRLILQRSDGVLEIRRGGTWSVERELSSNGATLAAADSSGRSRLVALKSPDNSLELVSTSTGQLVATMPSRSGSLYDRSAVAFTSSTGHLAILTEPTGYPSRATLTIYDLSEESLVDAACQVAWTGLDASKWTGIAPTIEMPTVC